MRTTKKELRAEIEALKEELGTKIRFVYYELLKKTGPKFKNGEKVFLIVLEMNIINRNGVNTETKFVTSHRETKIEGSKISFRLGCECLSNCYYWAYKIHDEENKEYVWKNENECLSQKEFNNLPKT